MFEEVKNQWKANIKYQISLIEPSCIRVEFDEKQEPQLNIHL